MLWHPAAHEPMICIGQRARWLVRLEGLVNSLSRARADFETSLGEASQK